MLLILLLSFSNIILVVYKGYFVPVDSTDCPPGTTITTTAKPHTAPPASSAQSWGDAPAKVAHKKTDVEVFEKSSTTKPKYETLDTDKQPAINIEIHNVFSFGASNSSATTQTPSDPNVHNNGDRTDSKISIPSENSPHPHIIYA